MADGREQAAPTSSAAAGAGDSAPLHSDAQLVDFLSSLLDYTPTVILCTLASRVTSMIYHFLEFSRPRRIFCGSFPCLSSRVFNGLSLHVQIMHEV